jgi:hypothetical protein
MYVQLLMELSYGLDQDQNVRIDNDARRNKTKW